ncbi:MAG TPA: tetratricopeptide repeat protein, partial [Rudaea sp.]
MAFSIHARMIRTVVAAVGLMAAGAAIAADGSVDDVYLALGKGDETRALALSADLLAHVRDSDPQRRAVLQARLDALYQLDKFDQGAALLRAAAARDAAFEARIALTDALVHGHPADALTRLAELEPAASPDELAELRAIEMRAAALVDGHLEQARGAAQGVLDAFTHVKGVRSAWLQVEARHFVTNVYYYTGSKADALAQSQAAFDLAVAVFGADSASRLRIDLDRASALVDLGRPSEALAVREGALAVTRKLYGEISIQSAKAEAMIGASLQEIGDYPSSSKRYAHAEEVLAQLTDPPSHDVGVIEANYGNLLQEMDDTEGSLAQYRKALHAWADDPQAKRARAVVYANTGNTEFRIG